MPPSMRRGGLLAWTIAPSQVRQAYFGKIVRFTRTKAGTTSRASRVSAPIRCSAPEQQGQTVVSGSITSSHRGRCLGSAPMLRTGTRKTSICTERLRVCDRDCATSHIGEQAGVHEERGRRDERCDRAGKPWIGRRNGRGAGSCQRTDRTAQRGPASCRRGRLRLLGQNARLDDAGGGRPTS